MRRRVLGEQRLQVGLDAVLDQAGVDAEVVAGVAEHLADRDLQGVAVAAPHLPDRGERLGDDAARERLGPGAGRSVSVQGGLIQLSGLYARSSAWIETDPSALTRMSRVAIGRWAVSRPA